MSETLAIGLGAAWTAGINLYATVAMLGLAQRLHLLKLFGLPQLPGELQALDNWIVIGVAVALYIIEFVADKVPYLDTAWDIVHTFIRVPAGALIAYSATSEMASAPHIVALLLGGGGALTSHGTKASVRAVANLSPEPVTNWILSLIEDISVLGLLVLAVLSPIVLLIVIALLSFVCFFLMIWLMPKALRVLRIVVRRVRGFFGRKSAPRPLYN